MISILLIAVFCFAPSIPESPSISLLSPAYVAQGGSYQLKLDAKNAERLTVNGVEVSPGENGQYQKELLLESPITHVLVTAKNGSRNVEEDYYITREATAEEKKNAETTRTQNQLQRAKTALAGITGNAVTAFGSVDEIVIQLAVYMTYAKMAQEFKSDANVEVQKVGKDFEKALIKRQKEDFPIIRARYVEIVQDVVWKNNTKVTLNYGDAKDSINYIATTFVNNQNKLDGLKLVQDMLVQLRFKKVCFEWYEYDRDSTCWTLKSANDGDLVSQ